LDFPRFGEYVEWDQYRDGYEESVWLYYHPFQLVLVHRFTNQTRLLLTADYLSEPTTTNSLAKAREFWRTRMEAMARISKTLAPRIGLLLMLQNAYMPFVEERIHSNPLDPESFKRWIAWRNSDFDANEVHRRCGLSVEAIKDWRDSLAADGQMVDPLARWYVLRRIVNRNRLEQLEDKALLAHEYYKMTYMLDMFLKDITGKSQLEPDDLMDGRQGKWKKDFFGDPFDYSSDLTQRNIINYFLRKPLVRIHIFVEGDTEEAVLPSLLDAFGTSPEGEGMAIHNLNGTGGLDSQNILSMLLWAQKEAVPCYVIVDSREGAEKKISYLVGMGLLKEGYCRIWGKNFEEDNFDRQDYIEVVNEELRNRGMEPVDVAKVESEVDRKGLLKALDDVYYIDEGQRLLDGVLSKKSVALRIFSMRRAEIRAEVESGSYHPRLPIEQVVLDIEKIYRLP